MSAEPSRNTMATSGTGVSPVKCSGIDVPPRPETKTSTTSGTGVSPVKGVTVFTASRRNLPHWEEPGSIYFVTWSTFEKACLAPEDRNIVLAAIRHWDGGRWIVYAAVVMPDHVHVLVQPLRIPDREPEAWYELRQILHSVKSYSAHEVNRRQTRSGTVWQDEREDRIVRDDDEFWEKWQYIRDNPVKAGLADTAERYTWFYQRCGLLAE